MTLIILKKNDKNVFNDALIKCILINSLTKSYFICKLI